MVYVMYLFTCYASAHTVILSELFCRAHVSAEARARSRCSPVEWRPLAQSQPNLSRGGRPRWAPASDSGLGMLDTFSQITVLTLRKHWSMAVIYSQFALIE